MSTHTFKRNFFDFKHDLRQNKPSGIHHVLPPNKKRKALKRNGTLSSLPEDLLFCIWSYLYPSDLNSLSMTCKAWFLLFTRDFRFLRLLQNAAFKGLPCNQISYYRDIGCWCFQNCRQCMREELSWFSKQKIEPNVLSLPPSLHKNLSAYNIRVGRNWKASNYYVVWITDGFMNVVDIHGTKKTFIRKIDVLSTLQVRNNLFYQNLIVSEIHSGRIVAAYSESYRLMFQHLYNDTQNVVPSFVFGVWDIESGELIYKAKMNDSKVQGTQISSSMFSEQSTIDFNGKYVLVSQEGSIVRVWDEFGNILTKLRIPTDYKITISRFIKVEDQIRILTCSANCDIIHWDIHGNILKRLYATKHAELHTLVGDEILSISDNRFMCTNIHSGVHQYLPYSLNTNSSSKPYCLRKPIPLSRSVVILDDDDVFDLLNKAIIYNKSDRLKDGELHYADETKMITSIPYLRKWLLWKRVGITERKLIQEIPVGEVYHSEFRVDGSKLLIGCITGKVLLYEFFL